MRGARATRLLARLARSESGFALIEAVMSAALVAIVAIGIYAGIDGPTAVSAADQSRSVAAALAQQDQERMHDMRTVDLSNYQATRTATVNGVPYTVASRADWATDSTGTISCTSTSSQANYLKITSTVTWPGLGSGRPVTLESIVAPAAGAFGSNLGNLSIQLQDQAGNALTGVPVSISGTPSLTLATNSLGCAFFGNLNAGTYQTSYSQPGYVDLSGNNAISFPASVTAGSTNVVTQSYAQAASIAVSFNTQVGGNQPQPAQASAVTVVNAGIPNGSRTFTGGPSTIQATNLFPFTNPYAVYAGGCNADNPQTYNANYYNTNPGFVQTQPGGSFSVTVREPAINILVKKNGQPLANANVRMTPSGCSDTYPLYQTNAQGALDNPGFPFGTYTVCADDGNRHKVSVSNVANTTPGGTSTVNLAIPANQSSPC